MHESTPLTVTKTEAGRRLGLTRDTVRKLVTLGALREVTLAPGTVPRLVLEDIERLAREGYESRGAGP